MSECDLYFLFVETHAIASFQVEPFFFFFLLACINPSCRPVTMHSVRCVWVNIGIAQRCESVLPSVMYGCLGEAGDWFDLPLAFLNILIITTIDDNQSIYYVFFYSNSYVGHRSHSATRTKVTTKKNNFCWFLFFLFGSRSLPKIVIIFIESSLIMLHLISEYQRC